MIWGRPVSVASFVDDSAAAGAAKARSAITDALIPPMYFMVSPFVIEDTLLSLTDAFHR